MKINLTFVALAPLILLILIHCSQPNSNFRKANLEGKLFIIGGGNRDSTIMKQLIKTSNWKPGDWITIASMASRWDSAFISMNNEFQFYTQSKIRCIKIDSNTVKNPITLDSMRKSKIVYLNGGDQSVFMMHIQNTDFKKVVNEVFEQGGTIAGTSAGAALMSEKMLTGNQLKSENYTSAVPVIWRNNIEIVEGLGFLDSVVIDQHFLVRNRNNRLLASVLDNPKYEGIGIDESTAIIVMGDSATVIGESQVIHYKNPERISTSGENLIGAKKLSLSIYLPGERFRIKR
jgi:cyanophycinase